MGEQTVERTIGHLNMTENEGADIIVEPGDFVIEVHSEEHCATHKIEYDAIWKMLDRLETRIADAGWSQKSIAYHAPRIFCEACERDDVDQVEYACLLLLWISIRADPNRSLIEDTIGSTYNKHGFVYVTLTLSENGHFLGVSNTPCPVNAWDDDTYDIHKAMRGLTTLH